MFENCKSYDANNTWESVKYSGTSSLFNRAYNHKLILEQTDSYLLTFISLCLLQACVILSIINFIASYVS